MVWYLGRVSETGKEVSDEWTCPGRAAEGCGIRKRGHIGRSEQEKNVTSKEIIKELLRVRKMSQNDLTKISKYKSQSSVSGVLNRGNSMRLDSLMAFLVPLGCELYIRDPETGMEYKVEEKERLKKTAEPER